MDQPDEEIHFTLDPQAEGETLPQSKEDELIPITYVYPTNQSGCCPYVQYFSYDLSTQMKPQASEAPTGNSLSTQNVTFHDYSPGATVSVASQYDDVHNETIENDLDLNNFFSRPVLISFVEWQVGNGAGILSANVNPWSLYFRNKRVSMSDILSMDHHYIMVGLWHITHLCQAMMMLVGQGVLTLFRCKI